MAKGNDKPKPVERVKRNADRRNGKAFKKNCNNAATTDPTRREYRPGDSKFGYSGERLAQMAHEQGRSVYAVVENLAQKLDNKIESRRRRRRDSAQRPGGTKYKMDSVNRHWDKSRPYPCVPKGAAHAGRAEKKTDTRDRVPAQRGLTKAEQMERSTDPATKARVMNVQDALRAVAQAALTS